MVKWLKKDDFRLSVETSLPKKTKEKLIEEQLKNREGTSSTFEDVTQVYHHSTLVGHSA